MYIWKCKLLKGVLNQKGLSMIEILVSFSILIIAFVSLSQAFPMGLSINKSAENSTVAYYLAQEKVEELMSTDYDSLNVGTIEAKQRLSLDQGNYLYNFQRKTDVIYVDGDMLDSLSDLGLKKISTIVYFNDAITKKEKAYTVNTVVGKK